MSGDRIVSIIAILAVLFLVVNGLQRRHVSRGAALMMGLLWFGLFGLVALIFLILAHYGVVHLT